MSNHYLDLEKNAINYLQSMNEMKQNQNAKTGLESKTLIHLYLLFRLHQT